MSDEEKLTNNQKLALEKLRQAGGDEVRIVGVTGAALANLGFAERVAQPAIPTGRGHGSYKLKS